MKGVSSLWYHRLQGFVAGGGAAERVWWNYVVEVWVYRLG